MGDLVTLKTRECTLSNFQNVLEKTRALFKKPKFAYDALLIVFSGHGSGDSIKLSDGKFFSCHQLLSFFNGLNCPSKIEAPKIIILDACRGSSEADAIDVNIAQFSVEEIIATPKGSDTKRQRQPNFSRFVFRSGTKPFVVYDNT